MPKPYPNNLKHHRKRKHLKQKEMRKFCARELSSSITAYENGERLPDLEAALVYSIVLNVPISKLIPLYYDQLCKRISRCAQEIKASLIEMHTGYMLKGREEILQEIINRMGCLQDISQKEDYER